jgi:transcriptional regulator with XRE-family HTH domain
MDAAGLSQADLKRLTGISDSIISKWRRDQATPSIENLRLLAPVLGVTTRDLVVRAGHMLPEEVGLTEPPRPPEPYRRLVSIEDAISAIPDLSDRDKRLMTKMYEELLAQAREGE